MSSDVIAQATYTDREIRPKILSWRVLRISTDQLSWLPRVFFCSDSDLRLRLRLVGVVVQRHVRQCGIHLMSYMYTNILIEEGIAKYP